MCLSAASHLDFFPHCFLKHQNHFKLPYAKVHVGAQITQRCAKYLCSRLTQSWVFFTLPTSPFFLLLSNFYFWTFLWKLEGLGLKGFMITGSSLSAKLGNTQPLMSVVGQARSHLQTFSRRRKQAQNMARLGILSGHLVSEPSDLPRAICWPILLAH